MIEDALARRIADEIAAVEWSFDVTAPVEQWQQGIHWLLSRHRPHQAMHLVLKRRALEGDSPIFAFLLAKACHLTHQPNDAVAWLWQAEASGAVPAPWLVDAIAIEIGAGADQAALARLQDFPDSAARGALLMLISLWERDPTAGVDFIAQLTIDPADLMSRAMVINRLMTYLGDDPGLLNTFCGIAFQGKNWSALELVFQRFIDNPSIQNNRADLAVVHSNLIRAVSLTEAFDKGRRSVRYFIEEGTEEEILHVAQSLRFIVHDCVELSPHRVRTFLEQLWIAGREVPSTGLPRWAPSAEDRGRRRLRVGILTQWLGTNYEFSIAKHRDRQSIAIFAFACNKKDQIGDEGQECYDEIFPVESLSEEDLADLILSMRIDILIDLTGQGSGFTRRVFDYKPAPIQVVWTTKLVTTGNDRVDWFLADSALIPPDHDDHFTEGVWRYPQVITPWTSTFSNIAPMPPPRHRTGRITFGSPASAFKVTKDCIALWHRVVAGVPGSRFLYGFRASNDCQIVSLAQRFLEAGFAPDQFVIVQNVADGDLQRVLSHIDIALDSAPFGCNRTAAECLQQGVPLLTLWGDRLIGRYTATQLAALGLDAFIATDPDDYVAKAVALANEPQRLDQLRASLPDLVAASPIVDPVHAMRVLESALWGMWQHYLAQSPTQA